MNSLLKLMLLALSAPALVPGLSARVIAQTPPRQPTRQPTSAAPQPLLQMEGGLQADDATLSDGRFYDIHEFVGQVGQTVTILLESEMFDPYLILADNQGNPIATNDNINSVNANAALIIALPSGGRYRVAVVGQQADAQGPYRLTIHPALADQPNPMLSVAEVTLLEANQRFKEGIERFQRSEFRAALALWETALALFRADTVRSAFLLDSRQGEANSLGNLGLVYDALGDHGRAVNFHQQSLAIKRQLDDRQGEANSLGNLGLVYDALGDYARAIDFLQQSLAIARQLGDSQGEVKSLGNLGLVHYNSGDYGRAIDFHQQSLAIARQLGDRQGEANALGNLGNAYYALGDYGRAIDFHQQSLAITHQLGDRQGEADSLGNLGNAYYTLGDYDRAIDFHQQSLAIDHQLGDHQGEAVSLGGLGNAYYALGDYGRAIDFHQQSLAIARQLGYRQGEAASLGGLGNAYQALGDYGRAIDFLQQTLSLTRQIRDRQFEANSLGNLGVVYDALGDYARAIESHQQSLTIKRQIGDRQGEAKSLGNLGSVYDALGDYARAIDFHQQSLAIARQIGDRQWEAGSLGNLGSAYHALGDYARAIDFHQQSLAIDSQISHRQGEANSLGSLGNVYHALGDYARAIDFHQEHLNIARQIGDRQGEANSLGSLGNAYHALGDYARTIDFHQQSLDITRQLGDRRGESVSLHNLGVLFQGLEDLAEAERYFQLSAHVQESLHSADLADANRLSFLDSQQKTYLLWQTTLMAQGRPETALEVAERGRAQALAASMARSLDLDAPPPNLERIQAIAAAQNATLVEYSVLPSGRLLIWVVQPDGSLQSAESTAAALDDSLLDVTDALASRSPNRNRGAQPIETPLSALVQDAQAALTVRGGSPTQISRQDLDRQLQQLHAVLIEPIAQWLPEDDRQRVIFIPHRELFRVPFAALRDADGQYLIQKHTILTAPSIQSLALTRQHRDRIQTVNATDALVVGNPTLPAALQKEYGWRALPGAEREARQIGGHLSQRLGTLPEVLLHDQATETRVKERLHAARFIHLATHGALTSSSEAAGLPGLQYSLIPGVLAFAASDQDDGGLTADELLELTINDPLNAELVVLSACQTGQGPITSDGVYGLSRTLLTAGVPTLMVSLWDASDYHTVGLMDEFYRQFLGEGQDKGQALRQAMLRMIEQGDNNPQYWAAFTLVGEAQ